MACLVEKPKIYPIEGITKIAVRKEIACGEIFQKSAQIVEFLEKRFGQKECPKYYL